MNNLDELFNKIKQADDNDNLIIPKEYLKKFILSNLLIIKNKQTIKKDKIFDYLNNDNFVFPSGFELLDEDKQKKYLNNLATLIKLFYL